MYSGVFVVFKITASEVVSKTVLTVEYIVGVNEKTSTICCLTTNKSQLHKMSAAVKLTAKYVVLNSLSTVD